MTGDISEKESPALIGTQEHAQSYHHDPNADEALRVFEAFGGKPPELDDATSKRLLRCIDMFMMPIFCLVYGLNFLDKTTLSYASIMGLEEDLMLKGDNYQWLGSLFYIGYLVWALPAGRLLQWLPLGKYNGACIVLWGVTLCCFAAARNFPGAVAVRFILGMLEASVTPGFALMTAQWYTKREQAFRIALWLSFNGFAQIFGGLVAYGLARGNGEYTMAGWKIVFLLCGLLTVVIGIIFVLIVPDSQLNARWLSPKDRVLAVERVRVNQQGIGNKTFKLYQFKEAILDPITWAFFFLSVTLNTTNGGITNFFSQLIVSFGFTEEQSLLYGTPAGAVEVISLLTWGFISQKYGNRSLWAIGSVMASLVGIILIVALPLSNSVGRLVGYYLMLAYVPAFTAAVSLIASNIAGYTKKTTVATVLIVGYCVGNIIGPQTFRPSDAPRYMPAEIVIIVMFCVNILDLLFIYWYYRRQNAKKALVRRQPGYVRKENQEWLDLTDKENGEFIYEL